MTTPKEEEEEVPGEAKKHSDQYVRLRDVPMASGLFSLACGRGAVVMSNIFLSTALIYLASASVGCVSKDKATGDMKVDDDCEEQVYGLFRPAALITNIAAFSGFLSALFMPIAGAIIDFTDHRRAVGIGTSVFIVLVQATQIFTNQSNWMAMSILQALWGCSYMVLSKTYAFCVVSFNFVRHNGKPAYSHSLIRVPL